MRAHFNVVVAPRPYVGFYRPAYPVVFATSPVFFRPVVSLKTALGVTAAAVGINALSHAFNNRARPPSAGHGSAPLYQNAQQPPQQQRIQTPQPAQQQPAQQQPAQQQKSGQQQPVQPAATAVNPPTPPRAPTPLADKLDGAKGLKSGNTDPAATTALQKLLKRAGYAEKLGLTGTGRDGVDGVFGNRTASALEQFQIDNGLEKTGVLDSATLTKMHEFEQKLSPQATQAPQANQPAAQTTSPTVSTNLPPPLKARPSYPSPTVG